MKKLIAFLASALLLTGALLSTPAMANSDNGFAALQGVEVQALSSEEMAAITGELNAIDTANQLWAYAQTLTKYPKLQAYVVKLAQYTFDNRVAINALYTKYGLFTTCVSGGHYSC
ncbi:MAG: hypothetical protein WCD07_00125 [Burkholderiales bacterium]